ncbi:MAG TPA: hypothetical protein VFE14_19335 [Micromonosporaceae bacterium]|jgi:hypothetical protein|nr:hypothetical protein [Micromonosporaceae bacterium]
MSYPGTPPPAVPVIAQIGEIQVTPTAVRTPAGEFPLAGTAWQVTEQWLPEQRIPGWAVVVTVLGFFCVGPFSLLFLLARHTVYRGLAQVTVNSLTQQYVTMLPIADPAQLQHVQHQVNYVRSLAGI